MILKFQRTISIPGLLFASLSCMIGSGWLFGSFYTAQIAGPASIISWILGGGLIIFIALTFSELSTMLPITGGLARYVQFTHGTATSFCMSWLAWLSCVAVAPTEVQAICQYATPFLPWLTHVKAGAIVLTAPGLAAAAVLLLGISALNIKGIQTLTRYNTALTAWKVMVPLITIIALFSFHFDTHNLTRQGGFMPFGWHGVFASLPGAVVFSFLGFRETTSLAGETQNPNIAIPLAVIGSVLICIVLYGLIQLAYVGALSPEMLKNGWNHLHYTHDAGPFAGIAMSLGLSWLAVAVYSDAFISPTGTSLIYTATTARLTYAMSENRYAPSTLMGLNSKGVPARAVWINFCVGLILFFPFPDWQALIKFQSVAIVLAYGVGPISLLALRKQAPDLIRPFRLPYHKTLCYLAFLVCNLLAYWSGWETIWRLMLGLLLGILLLIIYRCCTRRDPYPLNLKHAAWLIPYFIGITAFSYFGYYGGTKALPEPWIFGGLILYSAALLWLATYTQQPKEHARQLLFESGLLKLHSSKG